MELFGTTRSQLRRSHAVFAPESFVRSDLPGWERSQGVILISPRIGARFVQYLALLEPGGRGTSPPAGVERVLYVIEGRVSLAILAVSIFGQAGAVHAGAQGLQLKRPTYTPITITCPVFPTPAQPIQQLVDESGRLATLGQEAALAQQERFEIHVGPGVPVRGQALGPLAHQGEVVVEWQPVGVVDGQHRGVLRLDEAAQRSLDPRYGPAGSVEKLMCHGFNDQDLK